MNEMNLAPISFCDKTAFNVRDDAYKSDILDNIFKKFHITVTDKSCQIYNNRYNSIIKNEPYILSTNTKGNRYYIHFFRDDMGHNYSVFIDRKICRGYEYPRIIYSKFRFKPEVYNGTLIEGELVKNMQGEWIFLMNDICSFLGKNCQKEDKISRIKKQYQLLENYYKPDNILDICPIKVKKYFEYHRIEELIDNFIPQLDYPINGIMFNSIQTRKPDILLLNYFKNKFQHKPKEKLDSHPQNRNQNNRNQPHRNQPTQPHRNQPQQPRNQPNQSHNNYQPHRNQPHRNQPHRNQPQQRRNQPNQSHNNYQPHRNQPNQTNHNNYQPHRNQPNQLHNNYQQHNNTYRQNRNQPNQTNHNNYQHNSTDRQHRNNHHSQMQNIRPKDISPQINNISQTLNMEDSELLKITQVPFIIEKTDKGVFHLVCLVNNNKKIYGYARINSLEKQEYILNLLETHKELIVDCKYSPKFNKFIPLKKSESSIPEQYLKIKRYVSLKKK